MSAPKYNKHVLRRTPTCVDITDRFRLFVGEPIYLQLRDGSTLSGRLRAIEEKDMRITIDTHDMGKKIIGCDLRLMSVATADGLASEGRNLVIVALVGTNLHIRIFDPNGTRVVDKAEDELMSEDTLTMLKKQLTSLPNESGLSQQQKQQILREATLIAGHTQIIQVADITITYFGAAAELQSAWQQWHNRQRPPPVHFRLKESEMDADRGPAYKETENIICAELYPPTPLDRHMAAVRRYLDGETATLDQALGLARIPKGKPPKKHKSKDLDTLCWKVFIRRELLETKRPWRKITAELPDASDSSAFREDMTSRHKAMMARALSFALEFKTSLPIKDPNLLKQNSPEREQAERLLEQIENFL